MSKNALEKVYTFFKKHDNISIVSIPLVFYPLTENKHPLDNKLEKTDIINVYEKFNYPQLSAPSCFIKQDAINDHEFNVNANMGEDAVF